MACSIQCQLVVLCFLMMVCVVFIVGILMCPLCVKLPDFISTYDHWEWDPPLNLSATAPENQLVNLTEFDYLIRSDACRGDDDVFLVILVHSAPGNEVERVAIRQTWGYATATYGVEVKTAFLLADPGNARVQRQLEGENKRYHDIVQGNFIDSYKNLTYKLIMGMKWASTYCSRAKYILKADDDVFVDVFAIITLLRSTYRDHNSLILCNLWKGMEVVRDKKSKWYLSEAEFPESVFKPYCSGWALVLSMNVARAFSLVSVNVTYLSIDDVMIGILADKLNMRFTRLNKYFAMNSNEIGRWLINRKLVKPPYIITPYNRNSVFLQNIWRKCEAYYLNLKRPFSKLFKLKTISW